MAISYSSCHSGKPVYLMSCFFLVGIYSTEASLVWFLRFDFFTVICLISELLVTLEKKRGNWLTFQKHQFLPVASAESSF